MTHKKISARSNTKRKHSSNSKNSRNNLREKLYFSMVDAAVLFDRELCKTAILLFGILAFETAKLYSNQVKH